MPSKTKMIIFSAIMFGVLAISVGSHLYYRQNQYQIVNIPYNTVDSIKVYDRVLEGNKSLTFVNKDSIDHLNKMLLMITKQIDNDSINFHSTKRLWDITLYCRNDKKIKLLLTQAPFMGTSVLTGLLSSGEYEYQNDTLVNFMIKKFKE